MGKWTDAFTPLADQPRQPPPNDAPSQSQRTVQTDDGLIISPADPKAYQPWTVQRGSGRPAMFLDLRRVEPRTGECVGTQMSYPMLCAVEYIGDEMISLDFGVRQYIVRGRGLAELHRHLQAAAVLTIQEFSARHWEAPTQGPMVTAIERVGV